MRFVFIDDASKALQYELQVELLSKEQGTIYRLNAKLAELGNILQVFQSTYKR